MYTYTQLKKLASTLEERVASFSSLKNNFLKLSVEISARLSTHGLEFLKHYVMPHFYDFCFYSFDDFTFLADTVDDEICWYER